MERRDDDNMLFLALGLLIGAASVDPQEYALMYRRIRERLRETQALDPGLLEILDEFIWRPRRGRFRRPSAFADSADLYETREVALSAVEGFRRSFEPSINQRLSDVSASLQTLRELHDQLDTEVKAGREQTVQVASDIHSYLWFASTGADFNKARLIRYVPVRVYVGDPVPDADALERVVQAFRELGNAAEFEVAEELPDESGSWYKRLYLKTKTILAHKEVRDSLAKAKAAAETTYLDKPQAEVTGLLADAAAKVINALSAIPGPCCGQVGSLLIVKLITANGDPSMVFKTLTSMELKRLEENAAILQQPSDILEWLASMASKSRTKGSKARKTLSPGAPRQRKQSEEEKPRQLPTYSDDEEEAVQFVGRTPDERE